MRRLTILLAVSCIILGTFIFSIAVAMLHRSGEFCFSYVEPYFLAFALIATFCSVIGIMTIAWSYPRIFKGYLAVNILLSLALFGVLIAFWRMAAIGGQNWWKANFLNKAETWNSILHCFQKSSFCSGHTLPGCCERPTVCASGASFNTDCLVYSSNSTTLCYYCKSCMKATFLRWQSDARSKSAGFSTAILLYLAVVAGQIYVFWRYPPFGPQPAQHQPAQPAQQQEQPQPAAAT